MANFGISEKIEKIETFISENLKIFGYDLNFLIWTPPDLIQPSSCQPAAETPKI